FKFDGDVCHDHAFSFHVQLPVAVTLQELHPCLMNQTKYSIVSRMSSIVDISNAHRNGSGEMKGTRQINFYSSHAICLPIKLTNKDQSSLSSELTRLRISIKLPVEVEEEQASFSCHFFIWSLQSSSCSCPETQQTRLPHFFDIRMMPLGVISMI